jgi:hypothetical protein
LVTEFNDTRGILEIWWERRCARDRQAMTPQYPLPQDGASNAIMSNFFSIVGFGDDRIGTKEKLGTMTYIARPVITESFLELWPKIKPNHERNP